MCSWRLLAKIEYAAGAGTPATETSRLQRTANAETGWTGAGGQQESPDGNAGDVAAAALDHIAPKLGVNAPSHGMLVWCRCTASFFIAITDLHSWLNVKRKHERQLWDGVCQNA